MQSALLTGKVGEIMSVLENLKRMLLSDEGGIGSNALAAERLEAHLSAAKQELRAYAVQARRLKADAAKLRQEADMWRRRAESAVASGRDDLAREALKRSFSLERDADELTRQAAEDETALKQLTDTVRLVGQRARRTTGTSVSLDAFGEFDRMSSRLETHLVESNLDAETGDGAEALSDALLAARIEELEASRQATEELHRIKAQASRTKAGSHRSDGRQGRPRRASKSSETRQSSSQGQSHSSDPEPELGKELDSIRQQLAGPDPHSHDETPDETSKDTGHSGV